MDGDVTLFLPTAVFGEVDSVDNSPLLILVARNLMKLISQVPALYDAFC